MRKQRYWAPSLQEVYARIQKVLVPRSKTVLRTLVDWSPGDTGAGLSVRPKLKQLKRHYVVSRRSERENSA